MSELNLKAKKRSLTGKKVKSLLNEGFIPGVTYGHKIANQNISIKYSDFEKVYKEAGENTLVNLIVEDASPVKVIIQETQLDLSGTKFIHADLYQVNMKEKINTEVELKFIGESMAVKSSGGTLIKNMDKILVECLPQDLIHEINVDISALDTIDKQIKIKDLKVGKEVKIMNDSDEIIAHVEMPRAEKIEEVKVEEKVEEKPATAESKNSKS